MISINRIYAMIYRYTVNMRHNFDRMSDMFYWPAMDLFVWGLTGRYFSELSSDPKQTMLILLTGLIFWIVVWRAQYEITTNLLAEMWDQNLVNIFASPLKVSEWIIAVMIFGFIKMIISIIFSAGLAYLLYGYPIFIYGTSTIPIILSLILTGWSTGFLIAALIIRYGQKIQTLAWMGGYIIAPFSALYYPIAILPKWAQSVAKFVPSSYMFEAMRHLLQDHQISFQQFFISFILNMVYLTIGISFFMFMFRKSKKIGLGRFG